MAGTISASTCPARRPLVSMESGLDGRNNPAASRSVSSVDWVSMESGLDGRNNQAAEGKLDDEEGVSMESGLDGRNNYAPRRRRRRLRRRLNGVRPRWPEQ